MNLSEVHGWGIGTSTTQGPKTYYIDDFRLWTNSLDDQTKPPDVITHELFIEIPIEQNSSRLVLEADRQPGLVVEKAMRLMCAWAELTTVRGFGYFKIDERAKLSGRRSSVRITFFDTPPEGMPVAMGLLRKGTAIEEDLMNAVTDAEEFIKACKLMESQSQTRGLQ